VEPTIIFVVLAGLLGLSLLIYGWRRDLGRANDWAKLLQALFTLGAFSLAAYWYFVERKGVPHADVTQTIAGHALGNDTLSIEAHIRIKNLGERLLRIREVQSHLQDVEAGTFGYISLARLNDDQYWKATRPRTAGDNRPSTADDNQFNGAELRWPLVRGFTDRVRHDIEPGETDLIVITFLLRCSEVRNHVRIATDVLNPDSGTERLAWKARDFFDLGNICPQQQGAAR
jgi:hypothetical protein